MFTVSLSFVPSIEAKIGQRSQRYGSQWRTLMIHTRRDVLYDDFIHGTISSILNLGGSDCNRATMIVLYLRHLIIRRAQLYRKYAHTAFTVPDYSRDTEYQDTTHSVEIPRNSFFVYIT